MTRVAWLTDLHLNFLSARRRAHFWQQLHGVAADCFVISGDIGEATSLVDYLERLAAAVTRPVYFVLGNHDYYYSSIGRVRAALARLAPAGLHYLTTQAQPLALSPTVGLVGHDAWSDGRYGDFFASAVLLNDYRLIHDLALPTAADRLARLHALGDEAAAHLRALLPVALAQYAHVLVVLHPPPFAEACWHNGAAATPENPYLPHYACKAAGDALRELALQYPHRQMTVLCGHTHGAGRVQILPNLCVLSGGAVYGHPTVQRVLHL
ncbi:MAG: metallophosphoesterase [Anaerolineae bacterium]|nr:metallophosphoesterase [Anaerolineae bacterium]